MKISIIVAAALNGAIGKDNALLWHLPDDLKRFKQRTIGHHILMGRKTFDAIGKPLPGRINIIVSGSKRSFPEGCVVVKDIREGLAIAEKAGEIELFIIGGGKIYEAALPIADTIYLTKVNTVIEDADTFFYLPEEGWEVATADMHDRDDKHPFEFEFIDLYRLENV